MATTLEAQHATQKRGKMGESCGLGSVFKEKSRKMEQKQPHYRCVRTLLKLNPFKILITPLKSNPQMDLEPGQIQHENKSFTKVNILPFIPKETL